MTLLLATQDDVFVIDAATGKTAVASGLAGRPTCLAADTFAPHRVWCGTQHSGVFRSDDAGATWRLSGLDGKRLLSVTASPAARDVVYAGAEPSEIWRSDDAGATWQPLHGLDDLPSSSSWAFPPKPDTHHVRWIACHPHDSARFWAAIEAGALISTADGGRTWRDRVSGGPYDTHELAIHPDAPDTLRVAAGDGYYESEDGGATWRTPRAGFDVGYLRSVAIDPGDPDGVIVSASSGPYSAYAASKSDGRLFRRAGQDNWERVRDGWPDPPSTIAPLLAGGLAAGELFAADERGIHRTNDGGRSWRPVFSFATSPLYLRGLAVLR